MTCRNAKAVSFTSRRYMKNKNKRIAITMGLTAAVLLAPAGLVRPRASALRATTPAPSPASVTTIVTGLRNPRGLNFSSDGALYVAEAGVGGAGPCGMSADNVQR